MGQEFQLLSMLFTLSVQKQETGAGLIGEESRPRNCHELRPLWQNFSRKTNITLVQKLWEEPVQEVEHTERKH